MSILRLIFNVVWHIWVFPCGSRHAAGAVLSLTRPSHIGFSYYNQIVTTQT